MKPVGYVFVLLASCRLAVSDASQLLESPGAVDQDKADNAAKDKADIERDEANKKFRATMREVCQLTSHQRNLRATRGSAHVMAGHSGLYHASSASGTGIEPSRAEPSRAEPSRLCAGAAGCPAKTTLAHH